jgi:hypothetical protein
VDNEKHEPQANAETQAEHDKKHDDSNGGFALRGPVGFGAEFPESSASESKWIIRAIAIAIVILSLCYGWSMI